MKKIFYYIALLSFTAGLVGFLFNLKQYDFFNQLAKISAIDFPNPLDEFTTIYKETQKLMDFGSTNPEWYEYIVQFFRWVGSLITMPILLIKDLFLDLYGGFQAIIYILGF